MKIDITPVSPEQRADRWAPTATISGLLPAALDRKANTVYCNSSPFPRVVTVTPRFTECL